MTTQQAIEHIDKLLKLVSGLVDLAEAFDNKEKAREGQDILNRLLDDRIALRKMQTNEKDPTLS